MKERFSDYEALRPAQSSADSSDEPDDWSKFRHEKASPEENGKDWLKQTWEGKRASFSKGQINPGRKNSVDGETEITELSKSKLNTDSTNHRLTLKHGHGLTYAALFLFTVILYTRPSEFHPSAFTTSIAFIVGLFTLAIFLPSQLSIDGTLTARLTEVNLVLLFCLTGLLSIPLAMSPPEAWATFNDTFIRCVVIFIVMINAVRTEARLKGLLLLTIAVSIWLSVAAINDYRLGLSTVEGYRVAGRGSGIFGNANDMALHLVTIVPIAVALFFGSRGAVRKTFFAASSGLMIAAIVLTYSRGGFIGMLCALIFLAWKIGRHRRLPVIISAVILLVGVLTLAPGNYWTRLLSIFIPNLDAVGSSDARREALYRSIWTALRHPLLGIGMGNFHIVSDREMVSHNAYTQVAAEMGMTALVVYVMFIITPLRKLGQIASETFTNRANSDYYYLAVGLQASLIGYMVSSFFASVAYIWYVYYLVAYAVCFRRIYESEVGRVVEVKKQKSERLVGSERLAQVGISES